MKKAVALLLLLIFAGFSYANDTYFFTSGGNLIPAEEQDVSVQMRSEVISIVLESDHYEVTVDFNFYNTGKELELLVGFHFFAAGGGHGRIWDFKCWTNGEMSDYSDMPIDREFSNSNFDARELENAYTRIIRFPAKMSTATKVSYKSEYGSDGAGFIIKYLYGTGSSWKGAIGKMTVRLENRMPYQRPDSFTLPEGDASAFTRKGDNKWEAQFSQIEPKYTDCISIHTRDILDDTGPKSFPAYFRFAEQRANQNLLFWYTKPQLRIVRNTIYALHGYDFKSEDLQQLFSNRGRYWNPPYEVNPSFREDELSETERYNIRLILQEEERRGK